MLDLSSLARRAAAVVALAVCAVLVPPSGAPVTHAADNGAWSVAPTPPKKATTAPRNYFVLEGEPGDVIKDKVQIQNWTRKPITFKLYGADGYNTEQGGFFALRDEAEKMTDLGAWVTPVTSQVTVYGRTLVNVPVTVRIPENATPGDHVGGVVAQNVAVESSGGNDSVQVGVQRAVGARMYVRVSGTTSPGLEVGDVRLEHDRGALPWTGEGRATVSWTVENTGNLRLSPQGAVVLDGVFGQSTVELGTLPDLLPGEKVTLTRAVTGIPWIGRARAEVRLSAGDELGDEAAVSVWIVPWAAVVSLLLLLVAALTWWLRRTGVLSRKLRQAEASPKIRVLAKVDQ